MRVNSRQKSRSGGRKYEGNAGVISTCFPSAHMYIVPHAKE